ncbi:MAG: DUF2894 domain-containing protein [Burkholderiales bacterium]
MSGAEAQQPGLDPVGGRIIEALTRRAAAQQGEARALLMRRVEQLQAEHAAAKPRVTEAAATPDPIAARRAVLAGLSELVERLGRAPGMASRSKLAPTVTPSQPPTGAPNAVTAFKGTWSRLRADQRLRQALAQVPAMAGPLNSSQVINRTLQAMRDASPEYLDAFMSHVDTLLWLEQASGGDLAPRQATPAEGKRAPGSRTSR